MNQSIDLAGLRRAGMKLLCILGVVLALPVVGVALFFRSTELWIAAALAVAMLVIPVQIAVTQRIDASARVLTAATVAAMPALLLFAFQGYAWQVDLHMIFFALLAATAILADWRAILASATVVAVHHLLVGMLMPAWVFGASGSFGRILLHAAVLGTEAVVLMWLGLRIITLLDAIEQGQKQRADVQAEAERAGKIREAEIVVSSFGSAFSAISHGDLTVAIDGEVPSAYSALKTNFNEALFKLRELLGQVSESAATIRVGSGEIAQASENLARRTESNATSLEETATSVTQIDGRLKASAVAAARTVARADHAIVTVSDGRAVADEAVLAMSRVSDSAKGIDGVIEGLDKIAFQTRVLAMNAAVEAGRAGEAGRGFAVVADLVSALAMRAEEEAKRARDQLTVTQTDIGTAVKAVQRVDGALADISGDVGEVHELLATMAADNEAQSAAITEISAAIGTMDRATQQNAAMVEETSAAARHLAAEVTDLTEQANRFAIHTHGSEPASAVRARSRSATVAAE